MGVEGSKCCHALYFLLLCNTCLCVFSTCKDNRGIYSALRLDKVFNISSFLNTTVVSMHTFYIFSFIYFTSFIYFVMMNNL